MSRKDEKQGFWQPGFAIFRDELARQEKERLAPLRAELKDTSDQARKAELKREIAAVKDEFRTKRKNARHSLFIGR